MKKIDNIEAKRDEEDEKMTQVTIASTVRSSTREIISLLPSI